MLENRDFLCKKNQCLWLEVIACGQKLNILKPVRGVKYKVE